MERQFDRYNVAGLRNLARQRGLRRYSRLRRDELITLLINTGPSILNLDQGTIDLLSYNQHPIYHQDKDQLLHQLLQLMNC